MQCKNITGSSNVFWDTQGGLVAISNETYNPATRRLTIYQLDTTLSDSQLCLPATWSLTLSNDALSLSGTWTSPECCQTVSVQFSRENISATCFHGFWDGRPNGCSTSDIYFSAFQSPLYALTSSPTTRSPTRVPTTKPTKQPTRSPVTKNPSTFSPSSRSPSTGNPTSQPTSLAPTVPCYECEFPSCDLVYKLETQKCDSLHNLAQYVTGARNISSSQSARSWVCSFLQLKENSECHTSVNFDLYPNICAAMPGLLLPAWQESFNQTWCLNTSGPSLRLVEWNSSLPTNYTPPALANQVPCDSGIETQTAQQQLGVLSDVVAHPELYPSWPPITKVYSPDLSTAVLFVPQCYKTQVHNSIWIILLAIFLFFAAIATVLLFVRRRLPPLNKRDPVLLWSCLFWIVLNFIWVAIDGITGESASCGLISFGNLVAFPMLLIVYLLRALQLLFLFRWSALKLTTGAKDWYFAHRYLLSFRSSMLMVTVALFCCGILFGVTNGLDGTFTASVLGSGRCSWYDINPEVVRVAAENGIDLLPTQFNQNGFVPFSVDYSSCVFCTSYNTQIILAVITALLVGVMLVLLILLSKIADQFKLWAELVGVLLSLVTVSVVRCLYFSPATGPDIILNAGKDFGQDLLAAVMVVLLGLTIIMPALMTFTHQFKQGAAGPKTVIGEISRAGKEPAQFGLEDVLDDAFGMQCFKKFSQESFTVENVSFFQKYHEFKCTQGAEREQLAAYLYATFVQADCVMEVNIPFTMRSRYDGMKAKGSWEANAFEDVYQVVLQLMRTNDWRRFQKSNYWKVLSEDIRTREEVPIKSELGAGSYFRSSELSMMEIPSPKFDATDDDRVERAKAFQ